MPAGASQVAILCVLSGCSLSVAAVMMPSRPSEQVLEVESRVVLAQPAQAVPDGRVGEHHLQPEDVLPRIAVAQHAGAAGVGGDVATDLARTFGAEADRIVAAGVDRGALHVGQHASGVYGHGVVGGVDLAHAMHARQAQDDTAFAGIGDRCAGQTGIPALWLDRNRMGHA